MKLTIEIIVVLALAAAVYTDVRWRKIPNWLTFGLALIALVYQAFGGVHAFGGAMVALVFALVVGTVVFSLGLFGGGDVKLLAAICAIVGFPDCISVLIYTSLAGGVLAIVYAAMRGVLRSSLQNVVSYARPLFYGARPSVNVIQSTIRLPYAIAIAAGLALFATSTILPILRIPL